MAMSDNALLATVTDRVKRSAREKLPLTSSSLAQELEVLDVPAWRVESAVFSLEHSRKISIDPEGRLHPTMPPADRGRRDTGKGPAG